MTEAEALAELRALVSRTESQAFFARRCGLSQAYLSDVLNGNREIGPKILKLLGLKKVISYERVQS